MTTKENLRALLLTSRMAMTPEEVRTKSEVITDKLIGTITWSNITTLHVYRSAASWREVDTAIFVRELQQAAPHISTQFAPFDRKASLPVEKFDLIIGPMLGFDAANHRIGFGGGWYDRFLETQPQALKIGLCYQKGLILQNLPHELHDIPLDQIITET